MALDPTRDGQPGDFTQARTRGPEVFCIGFPFVEIRLCRHGAACQVAHGRGLTLRPDFEMKSVFLFQVTTTTCGERLVQVECL